MERKPAICIWKTKTIIIFLLFTVISLRVRFEIILEHRLDYNDQIDRKVDLTWAERWCKVDEMRATIYKEIVEWFRQLIVNQKFKTYNQFAKDMFDKACLTRGEWRFELCLNAIWNQERTYDF